MFADSERHVTGGDSHIGDKHVGDKYNTIIVNPPVNPLLNNTKQDDKGQTLNSFVYANSMNRPDYYKSGCYNTCPKCKGTDLNEHFFCTNPKCEAFTINQWGLPFFANYGTCPICKNGGVRTKWNCKNCETSWDNQIPYDYKVLNPNIISEEQPYSHEKIQTSYIIKFSQNGYYFVEPQKDSSLVERHLMYKRNKTWAGKWKVVTPKHLNIEIGPYNLKVHNLRDDYLFLGVEDLPKCRHSFRVLLIEENFFRIESSYCQDSTYFEEDYFKDRTWMMGSNFGHIFTLVPESDGSVMIKNMFMGWIRKGKWKIEDGDLIIDFMGIRTITKRESWKVFYSSEELLDNGKRGPAKFVLFPVARYNFK